MKDRDRVKRIDRGKTWHRVKRKAAVKAQGEAGIVRVLLPSVLRLRQIQKIVKAVAVVVIEAEKRKSQI